MRALSKQATGSDKRCMRQLLMQQAEPSLQGSMREEITKLVKEADVAKGMLQVLQRS